MVIIYLSLGRLNSIEEALLGIQRLEESLRRLENHKIDGLLGDIAQVNDKIDTLEHVNLQQMQNAVQQLTARMESLLQRLPILNPYRNRQQQLPRQTLQDGLCQSPILEFGDLSLRPTTEHLRQTKRWYVVVHGFSIGIFAGTPNRWESEIKNYVIAYNNNQHKSFDSYKKAVDYWCRYRGVPVPNGLVA